MCKQNNNKQVDCIYLRFANIRSKHLYQFRSKIVAFLIVS